MINNLIYSVCYGVLLQQTSVVPVELPTYYVSSSGDDNNDGLSELTPFATIDKVNTLTLVAGDKVGFKAGEEFLGTITVSDSGESNKPVKFISYGEGDKPKIYGSEIISTWTVHSGNIWKATFNTDITQLFVNGIRMQVARLNNSTYNTVTTVTSQTELITNIPNQAVNYYVGTTVLLRTLNYFSETRTVIASTGSTITLDSAPSATVAINQGFVMMNKLEFLDAAGEWYYDTATNTVYLWCSDSADPNSKVVRGSTINDGVDINGKSYITIKNLDILQHKENGIIADTGTITNITIDNCIINGQELYGIYMQPSTAQSIIISNNEISNNNAAGIYGYHVQGTISNNNIYDISLYSQWGILGSTQFGNSTGINWSLGNATGRSLIEYNDIINIGYNGIFWRGDNDIRYNYLKNTCYSKADGGAIYTGSPTSSGSIISYNIIENVIGEKSGFTMGRNYGIGIYLDENSNNCSIHHNTVYNTSDAGIFLHKPSNHTVQYNKTLYCRYNFMASNTATGTSTVTNNTFATGSATDDYDPRQLLTKYTTTGVTLNNNLYINGFASDAVFNAGSNVDFATWKTTTSQDAASTYDGTDLGANETQRLIYNNTNATKTFYLNNASSVKDELGISITSDFTLDAYTSKYVRGVNVDCILDYSDSTAPTVTAFTIPASTTGLTVTISSFTGSAGTTKYLITESSSTPTLTNANWSTTAQTTFTASTTGSVTLYAWVRDAAGNISSSGSATTDITFDILPNVVEWIEANGISAGTTVTANVGNNGTISGGGEVLNQTGSLGKAVSFNGTSTYMTIPQLAIFNQPLTNDFSVLVRFNQTTLEASNRIFQTEKATTDYMNICANNTILQATVAENNNRRGKQMAATLTTGTWYTVVVTYVASTKTVSLYVNGTVETTNIGTNIGIDLASTTMKVGRGQASTVYANFLWETSAVFDKVLSQQEVTYLQDKEYADL